MQPQSDAKQIYYILWMKVEATKQLLLHLLAGEHTAILYNDGEPA